MANFIHKNQTKRNSKIKRPPQYAGVAAADVYDGDVMKNAVVVAVDAADDYDDDDDACDDEVADADE